MATIDTVRDILQRNLEIDPAAVTEESTFDSLDMVELICDLEDELGIDFGEPEGLTTTADLVAYIDAL